MTFGELLHALIPGGEAWTEETIAEAHKMIDELVAEEKALSREFSEFATTHLTEDPAVPVGATVEPVETVPAETIPAVAVVPEHLSWFPLSGSPEESPSEDSSGESVTGTSTEENPENLRDNSAQDSPDEPGPVVASDAAPESV